MSSDPGKVSCDLSADSPTEVGLLSDAEKLANRDIEDDLHEKIRRRSIWAGLRSYRFLLDIILLLVILALLIDKWWEKPRNQYEMSGDLTGFAPRFRQQIVEFKLDPMFAPANGSEFFTNEVHKKWTDLVPRGLGYINMKNPTEYSNLPTPLPEYLNRNMTVFTTSMTHQLHCLHSIIEVYSAMTSINKVPSKTAWHLPHCFEYLRQSIMCCGDTALEGTETTFPDGVMGSDGWDAKHVCKDYRQVYEYLEKERANNMTWI